MALFFDIDQISALAAIRYMQGSTALQYISTPDHMAAKMKELALKSLVLSSQASY